MIVKNKISGKYIIIQNNHDYYVQILSMKYGINVNSPKKKYYQILQERIKKFY